MSRATEATRCDDERIPRRIKVKDSDGGETTYIRSETKLPRPADFAELKHDKFHPNLIELGTKNGEIMLQQPEKGLPSKCVISYAPLAAGFVESTYQFFVCEKQ